MANKVFRKVALERLASPEQLDQLMSVTNPKSWMALVAVGCVVLAFFMWGITGSIPTRVAGQGILIKAGGISNVVSPWGGQVTDIRVVTGSVVHRGEVVARINEPGLMNEILQTESEIKYLGQSGQTAERDLLQGRLNDLKKQLQFESEVVCPMDGQVLEVKVNRDDFIQPGDALFSVESNSGSTANLEAMLYVPVGKGKTIVPGMSVQIAPSVVKKEQYGYMMGRVVSVSEYPATSEGMMRILDNEQLVKKLSGGGAPLEVQVALIPDKNTVSGYKWSSISGPPMKINQGTLCTGLVTITSVKPISLVAPSGKSK